MIPSATVGGLSLRGQGGEGGPAGEGTLTAPLLSPQPTTTTITRAMTRCRTLRIEANSRPGGHSMGAAIGRGERAIRWSEWAMGLEGRLVYCAGAMVLSCTLKFRVTDMIWELVSRLVIPKEPLMILILSKKKSVLVVVPFLTSYVRLRSIEGKKIMKNTCAQL